MHIIKYIFFCITGSYQGKNQPDGILKGDRSYLMESFKDGKVISLKVPEPKYTKTVLGNLVCQIKIIPMSI